MSSATLYRADGTTLLYIGEQLRAEHVGDGVLELSAECRVVHNGIWVNMARRTIAHVRLGPGERMAYREEPDA